MQQGEVTAEQVKVLAPDTDWGSLAPPDPTWHRQYAKTFALIYKHLEALRSHPGMQDAEDLGDYIDTIVSLLSFRPHTVREVEEDAYKDVFGADFLDEVMLTDKLDGGTDA